MPQKNPEQPGTYSYEPHKGFTHLDNAPTEVEHSTKIEVKDMDSELATEIDVKLDSETGAEVDVFRGVSTDELAALAGKLKSEGDTVGATVAQEALQERHKIMASSDVYLPGVAEGAKARRFGAAGIEEAPLSTATDVSEVSTDAAEESPSEEAETDEYVDLYEPIDTDLEAKTLEDTPENEIETEVEVKEPELASAETEIETDTDTSEDSVEVEDSVDNGEDGLAARGVLGGSSPEDTESTEVEEPEETLSPEEKERLEKIDDIEKEVMEGDLGKRYNRLLGEYARVNADFETRGLIGRKKREQRLKDIGRELAQVRFMCARSMYYEKTEAGLYGEQDSMDKQQASDDLFNEVRKIDSDIREQTNVARLEKIENRNVAERAMVAVGRFLNKGKTAFRRGAKNFGVGAGIGVLTGFSAAVAGVGFPVTTAAGVGLAFASRHGAKRAYQDEALRSRMENGEASAVSDEQFKQLVDSLQNDENATLETQARELSSSILDSSREASAAERAEASKKASARTGEIMAGFAIGSFVGNIAGGFVNNAAHNTPTATEGSGGTDSGTNHIDGGKDMGGPIEKIAPPPSAPEYSVAINTNGAPEHALQNIIDQAGGSNLNTDSLLRELYNTTGGNVFDGVSMRNYGGNIGIGFSEWNVSTTTHLSEAAKAVLRAKGVPV